MIIFKNVRIFDGTGSPPFAGEVSVKENRIVSVTPGGSMNGAGNQADAHVIDGEGATLMPGMVEAHAHLTWPSSVERPVREMAMPPEALALTAARNARILLDHGITSAYSAGAMSQRLEIYLADQIESGGLPGPRFIPSSIEKEPPAGEDNTFNPGKSEHQLGGPEEVRAFIKECAEFGAKSVKFLLSGESQLRPGASFELQYRDEELQAAHEQAVESGIWLNGHAHAAEAVKLGARHGFRVLYHCTHADEEALDLLEERKDDIFVAPAIGVLQALLDFTPPPGMDLTEQKADARNVIERHRQLIPEMRRRGIRVLPFGDYGFPFNPHGWNARDLDIFVKQMGFTPIEALVAATKLGGQLMDMGDELGMIKPGYLADIVLVKGDVTQDVTLLQDKSNILAVMKDGKFHKEFQAQHSSADSTAR
ncbi:TPA: amidohydrolase family protein [Burkholderia cenocepacia]|uniref:amidohydrolase family protein n=1 Tax=unclassified Burkholderia TaxID=2613784 RepID=UPI00158CCBCD|nr:MULTISPECIES: amidohydrolase family protein [unclassified Burkholderia]HEF5873867.1 amidohydrolase family protein [Burkholderia cenocepacia]